MEQVELLKQWQNFSSGYNFELKENIWEEKSKQFGSFWTERILPDDSVELSDEELDKIIQILDRNAKGNTREQEAVAKAMIAQGAWRRMFKEIKNNPKLKKIINSIFIEEKEENLEHHINELYKINEGRKNFLTGSNGNAINDMMFAYNPKRYIAVVSLNHRMKIINYFGFQNSPNFEEDSAGKKIVLSNKAIIEGFKSLGISFPFPRSISDFLYTTLRDFWNKKETKDEELTEDNSDSPITEEITEEKIEQLREEDYQKLIHNNFKKIFPDLTYIDEDYQNQHLGHYITTEGKIMDFLCKDKKDNFVVIELKIRGADEALGQVCRYMGWVKENLCENKEKVRGIIISEKADLQLDYAIKVVTDVTFKRMWLEVKIKDWEK
jgi:hypothetical protein